MTKYSLSHLARLMHAVYSEDRPISGVCVDSRLIQSGDLFFALKGAQNDGHDFLAEVAAKGAAAAVVCRSFHKTIPGLPLISVDDVLKSLQQAAKSLLAERGQRIMAVTGSLGKTTTKEFLASLLAVKYRIAFSPGNSNSQIGLPLAIINHTKGNEEWLVLEMGMTGHGHLKQLIDIAPPDIALITTTALVHACYFEDLADIGRAKAELFTHPKTQIGLLDRNIVNFSELCTFGTCRKLSFAVNCPADYTIATQENGQMVVSAPDGKHTLQPLQVPGRHNIHNFLAAATAAHLVGVSWEQIDATIPALQLYERRLQHIQKHGALFVNDAYNATAVSMKAALECLPTPQAGCKKIAVLGDMVELGKFSLQCHREVGEYALNHVDVMLCYGEGCKVIGETWSAAGKPVEWHPERAGVVAALRQILREGDVVLLKGSRLKGAWKVLEEL